jgi:transcriptional regulator of acetoin/glycerol metabolism
MSKSATQLAAAAQQVAPGINRTVKCSLEVPMRALEAHSWPGNIRELRNIIERAVALCEGPMLRLRDLPDGLQRPDPADALGRPLVPAVTLAESKTLAEQERITEALERNGNNRLRAAVELGICRMTLYKKLHKFGLMASAT